MLVHYMLDKLIHGDFGVDTARAEVLSILVDPLDLGRKIEIMTG